MTKRVHTDCLRKRTGLFPCVLSALLAFTLVGFVPASAQADVRKADVIMGSTVDSRGLSVAQCPSIDAEYACVMDANGVIYFERGAQTPVQIASITKVMTALVVLEAVDSGVVSLNTSVEVTSEAVIGESSAGLRSGDILDVSTALLGLLVPSGNDAAVALQDTVGSALIQQGKSNEATPEDAFIAEMNACAARIGCADTVFTNPHGLDFDSYAGNLHSTAADLALVVKEAMKNETFRADVSCGSTSITVTRDGSSAEVYLETTDAFLDIYEYAIGVKTGFTELAGPSFAAAANNGKQELYAMVLHSSSESQRFLDAQALCEWTYEHIVTYQLANSDVSTSYQGQEVPVVAEVGLDDWIDKRVKATLDNPSATVDIFDLNGNVSQQVSFDSVPGTVHAGDKVGTITFKQRNNVIATASLVATETVEAPGVFEGIGIWFDRLFRSFSGAPQKADSVVMNTTPLVNDKTSATSV